jgi:DNA-binding transcriptional MocR family regulator
MDTIWRPSLELGPGTLHERLLDTLRGDIAAGTLGAGARMPTHRELARTLGIGIGTVSKLYAEAERLGLLTSRVGRGTFVAASLAQAVDGPLDLTLNLPPSGPAAARLGETLTRLGTRSDLARYIAIPPQPGLDRHRQAGAEWLRRWANVADADWRRILVTSGAQHGMSLALDAICRQGETILTDAVTFHGASAIADHRGFSLIGVAMDREGLLPDALEEAVLRTGARVVYVQPTLQNPTARSMSLARREAIVRVARRHDLWLLECDVYSPLARAGAVRRGETVEIVPIASLAPERTLYAGSVSKSFGAGLRVGYLVAPSEALFDRLCLGMRAGIYSTGTLGPLVASEWIADGSADDILREVAGEAEHRSTVALRALGTAAEQPSHPASLHLWLPMSELAAERTAGRLFRHRLIVTPPSSFTIAGDLTSGLRLCLGSLPDQASLDRALAIVSSTLSAESENLTTPVI